ncbi:hypothetical protein, partial [Arenibacter sp. F20364]|uniref:hypothetical protein n=1 Tax=Arenibacter sp. F20364 TaxID=2926415 RepID=UPI001FF6BFF3
VQGVTPAHKGLAPSRLIPYLRYDKDAHAGHTHGIKAIAVWGSTQTALHLNYYIKTRKVSALIPLLLLY